MLIYTYTLCKEYYTCNIDNSVPYEPKASQEAKQFVSADPRAWCSLFLRYPLKI